MKIVTSVFLAVVCWITSVSAQPGTPVDVVPIPWVPFQIAGSVNSVNNPGGAPVDYRAYTVPGDPFRIVVEESNLVDEALIYAKYASFKVARQSLIQLAGIDARDGAKPIDIHIAATTWTGPYQPGITTGFSGTYRPGSGLSTGYVALFDVDKTNRILEFTPENACRIEDELLAVHEYGHQLFYGRSFWSYEDYVKAFSFYICGHWDGEGFEPENFPAITDPTNEYLNHQGMGRLIYELAKHHGATWPTLRKSLIAMVKMYEDGGGEAEGQRVSSNQYRWILNGLLANDTLSAFLAAGHPPSDHPTRSRYFPYVVEGDSFKLGFRCSVPASIHGDVQGLLYFYNSSGKPHEITLATSGGAAHPSKRTSHIHPVMVSSQNPQVLAYVDGSGSPKKQICWARFDSLAPIDIRMVIDRAGILLPGKYNKFEGIGIPASSKFVFKEYNAGQRIAIVNPGNQELRLRIEQSRFCFGKTHGQLMIIKPGCQVVSTIAELTSTNHVSGKLMLTGNAEFVAAVFPMTPSIFSH